MTEEQELFTRWMETYATQVLRLCWLSLGDRSLAEDALQETFVKVWRNIRRFRPESEAHLRAWICRIAVNTCRDIRRSRWWRFRGRSRPLDEAHPLPAPEADDLTGMILELPEDLRRPVLLHGLEGLTLEETARALGISRPTVSKRLKEAYALLRVAWKEEV